MGCTHVSGCPLFPKLNASLRGWRDAYCDSESGWHSCARYQQSRSGVSVPLTLLPNGKYAQTITRTDAPPATAGHGVPRFRPVETSAVRLAGPGRFEAAQGAAGPEPSARPVPFDLPAARPGWWVLFRTWMRGPA